MKWNYFLGASLLTGVIMLALGAPMPAVPIGIGLAAFLSWRKKW